MTPVSSEQVRPRHILVVEAFDGHLEYLTDEVDERSAATMLGLPMQRLAEMIGARATVLEWSEWHARDGQAGHPSTWDSIRPSTRPSPLQLHAPIQIETGDAIVRRAVPALDPEHGQSLAVRGAGPLSHGLLASGDFYLWLSYCVRETMIRVSAEDPFDLVVVPQWGGLGYLAQLGRIAQLDRALDVPFVTTVTDPTVQRRIADEEGEWTRENVIRRQMEDLSVALADGAIVFGARGLRHANARRLRDAEPAVLAPRRIEPHTLERLQRSLDSPLSTGPLRPFLYEPQRGSAGALVALDAVAQLDRTEHEVRFASAGPDCVFAPMRPRTFRGYWSTRGFVRDLMQRDVWSWHESRPTFETGLPFRVFPSSFEYLPAVHLELARGSAVLVSEAAAEGLAPETALPSEVLLSEPVTGDALARSLDWWNAADQREVDDWRRKLTAAVVHASEGSGFERRLEQTATLLERAMRRDLAVPDAGRCFRLLLDRRQPLNAVPGAERRGATPIVVNAADAGVDTVTPAAPASRGRLTAVITCFELGALVTDAVRSVWANDRADEVLLIDDGSRDAATSDAIGALEAESARRALPLRVMRQPNRGLAEARNRGLAEAKGEFVSFLDGDDVIEASFYRLAVPVLERFPQFGGVAAWAFIFGDGVPEEGWFWNATQPELPSLLVENGVIVPCVMRTAVLRELGGYAVRQRYNYEDWELSVRLLARGWPIFTIPAYLMRYRVRRDSMYRAMTDAQHNVMLDRMLNTHRDVVDQFGVELALLLEERRLREAAATESPQQAISHSLAAIARSSSVAFRGLLDRIGVR